jgi:flavin reductase (DIM6/NTAB) family NADH-FMN oxidoreductase RutF
MIDANEFKRVMGHFPSGVTIVTTFRPGGDPCGLTVNAFSSVSLEPPLVLVCVERDAESHDCIVSYGGYAVNVLADEEGEKLSRRFAQPLANDKFEGVAYASGRAGLPILKQSLAWMECRVVDTVEAGDHTIFIGEVIDGDAGEGHPLVYYRGGYGRFDP